MGFGGREKRVGLHIPRPDPNPTAPTRTLELRATFGTNLKVILEHDRLAIKNKTPTGIVHEQVQDAIDCVDQSPPETLHRPIPLPIPMWSQRQQPPKTSG